MSDKINWVKIASLSGEIEAELLMGLLETNEVPARKVYPGITQYMKVYMGTTLGVEVHVPADRLEEAKKIIEELDEKC